MAIVLPDFGVAKAEGITACGFSKTTNGQIDDLIEKYNTWIHYTQETPSGTVNIRFGVDSFQDGYHLHVDCGTRAHYRNEEPPKPSDNVPSLDEILSPFMGQELGVLVYGYFSCPIAEAPEIIKVSQKIAATKDGITLKMTSGAFSVEGSPIKKIWWEIVGEKAKIGINGETELAVSDNYLQEAMAFISKYYTAFMRRGLPDGND